MDCPICSWSPDNSDYPLLFATSVWRVVLAPNQSLLGKCVIHLKRHAGDLANLTQDEAVGWLEIVQTVEAGVRTAFGAAMFNWSCLMNLSYRESSPNPHIHWWAVPRYNRSVTIDDWVFEDPLFGNPYDHDRHVIVPQEIRHQIVSRLQNALLGEVR